MTIPTEYASLEVHGGLIRLDREHDGHTLWLKPSMIEAWFIDWESASGRITLVWPHHPHIHVTFDHNDGGQASSEAMNDLIELMKEDT